METCKNRFDASGAILQPPGAGESNRGRDAIARGVRFALARLGLAAALSYGGGYWLHLLHSATAGGDVAAWLRDSTVLLPVTLLAMLIAGTLTRRLATDDSVAHAALTALTTSLAASLAGPLYAWAARGLLAPTNAAALFLCSVAGVEAGAGPTSQALLRDGLLLLPAHLAICALAALLKASPAPVAAAGRRLGRPAVRRSALVAGMAALMTLSPFGALLGSTPAAAAPAQCQAGSPYQRSYDVVAINVHIPYNRWGDLDRNGMMYALAGDESAYRNWATPLDSSTPEHNRRLRPRPLVLRANAGDCVKIRFTNKLDERQWGGELLNPRASMHPIGIAYNAATSDGGNVGYNPDTTIGRGESIEYYWLAPEREGLYLFRDTASPTGSEADGGSVVHGLFGALAVEPAGSTWLDPVSGAPLYSSQTSQQSGELYIDAIIVPPSGGAFRESVQLAQDEIPGIGFGFNYGAEPAESRTRQLCPDCVGEETSLSSWVYGDPGLVKLASGEGPWLPAWADGGEPDPEDCGLGTPGFTSESCWTANVTRAYRWDRFKLRYALTMTYETHVFHLHANQWRAQPDDSDSTIIDSQTFGPGDSFTADLIGGAGSLPGTVGDSIFHCHLYPHFAAGFWALLRVHDVIEDGSMSTPDGIRVRTLQPLPSGNLNGYTPPAASAEQPGFPRFIPGEFGWRAPQPPLGIYEPNGATDDPSTVEREDVSPGLRMVAGKALDATLNPDLAARLAVEEAAMARLSGGRAKPGAPFTDPCPPGAREVTYNVSLIQLPIVYNEAGWFDNQARILVLDKDRDAILAGTRAPEPLFIRVNQGDCINFNLSNYLPNWFGGDAFVQLTQTNMMGGHIHLVKFDVLASDGSSNGWNYQQAAFTQLQTRFKNDILAGNASCSMAGCRLQLPTPADFHPQSSGQWPGQTIRERWYADSELRTVFTHDHHFAAVDQNRGNFGALIVEPAGFDFRNPVTGEFYQPINSAANGTPCDSACTGEARGARMDLIGPGANDDFREFGLAIQDFVALFRPGAWGNAQRLRNPDFAINPPEMPEMLPDEDPGTFAINYRNAPLQERRRVNGQPVDPAYVFSSHVFGDPKTPLLEAYAGDPVQFRLIQGSQEEQHSFQIHGMRWRQEPADPRSQLVNSVSIGISEAFNARVPQMSCGWDEDCRGDYLYTLNATDGIYQGAWGLLRVYGRNRNGLLPLPDTRPQDMTGNVNFRPSGSPPPPANQPGTPCVPEAPVKRFTVVAHDAPITYNTRADYHDPYGLLYTAVRAGETVEQAMARNAAHPEPMVLRVNEGDCVEVTLLNRISPSWQERHGALGVRDGDPNMPTEPSEGTPGGLRVSLHPQLLQYDVRGSDGATVGYNRDQTVGPGGSITYRWYADEVTPGELGAVNLLEYGDVRGHRHHGLLAGLVVGPKGATYHDPFSGAPVTDGAYVDVRVRGQADFRDLAVFYQDGLNLRRSDGSFVREPDDVLPPDEQHNDEGAPVNSLHPAGEGADENIGEKGFNYGTEPLHERLGRVATGADDEDPLTGSDLAQLFSSWRWGDPATPILRAYAGDPVRVRLLQTGDRPRQHVFQIGGHAWLDDPGDPNGRLVGAMGGVSVGRSFNLHLDSAGSMLHAPGDYQYGSVERNFFESRGLWGIFRVYGQPPAQPLHAPSAIAAQDNPYQSGAHPLVPLERVTVSASVFADQNMSSTRNNGEAGVAGIAVNLLAPGGGVIATQTTDASGSVSFHVRAGLYDLEVLPGAGRSSTTASRLRVDAQAENSLVTGSFGLVKLSTVHLALFQDGDGDGMRGSGEGALAGWSVRLRQGGTILATSTSGADGRVSFADRRPGSYSLEVIPAAGYFATSPNPVNLSLAGDDIELSAGFAPRAGLSVTLFNDSNNNGVRDSGEEPLSGWRVSAYGGPTDLPPQLLTGSTSIAGSFTADDPAPEIQGVLPGTYIVQIRAGRDWICKPPLLSVATGTAGSVSACNDNTVITEVLANSAQTITLPYYNPNHWVVAEPFNDINRNGTRESGEGKLVGWQATLRDANGGVVAQTTTGNDGRATWYIAPAHGQTRSYQVEVTPPGATIAWTPTTGPTQHLTVAPGTTGIARIGFVQLSTVGVRVFEDHDRDGLWDPFEGALANRNVVLYDRNNRTVLSTLVTGPAGDAAFRITAGRTYYLEVLAPTGWTRTTPLAANGTPITRLKLVAPANGSSLEVVFGQYNTVDTTPPPAPTLLTPPGSYDSAIPVELESETGARFRYTLDGSTPTATTGHPLIDQAVLIAARGTTTLKVVAIDQAGNTSAVTEGIYNVSYGASHSPPPASFVSSPSRWTITKGGIAAGYVHLLAYHDGQLLTLRSSRLRNDLNLWEHMSDGYGTLVLPAGQRDLRTIEVSFVERGSRAGVTQSLYLWNYQSGTWDQVYGPAFAHTAWEGAHSATVADDPATPENEALRYVSQSSGEVRVRVSLSHPTSSYTDSFDMLNIRTQYLP